MRLLDTQTLLLRSFPSEKDRPQYAILSHTWGDGEVTFQDLLSPAVDSIPGYSKIKKCCEEANMLGFNYVWIDTCCIDKTSSAELSEAINSMYKWYQSATICFTYLCDVEEEENPNDLKSELLNARWFTRGWTLQELIAPPVVVFYNRFWVEIGTKETLLDIISLITDIPAGVLLNKISPNDTSLAQRMSWAAKRETTQREDIAYCLMGIFNVNMPTIYGEGDKAFIRLQNEIIKGSDDHTLFSWSFGNKKSESMQRNRLVSARQTRETGLLSTSPQYFSQGRAITPISTTAENRSPFSMTNYGLHIWLPLIKTSDQNLGEGVYQAILNCQVTDRPGHHLVIYLKENKLTGQYCRIFPETVDILNNLTFPPPREIFVKELYLQPPHRKPVHTPSSPTKIRIHLPQPSSHRTGYNVLDCSVDSSLGFIEVGTLYSDMEYIVIGSKFSPSVKILIVVRAADAGGALSFKALNVDSNINLPLSPDIVTARVSNEPFWNTVIINHSEKFEIVDINNTNWKMLATFRRGIPNTNLQSQHYRVAISFIPPGTFPDLRWMSTMNLSVRSPPECLTRLTLIVKPDFYTPKFWDSIRLSVWKNSNHKEEGPQDRYNGVSFSLPRLNWVTNGVQEGGYEYLWTPTLRHRNAVIALGLQKSTIVTLLTLSLDSDLKVRYQLQDLRTPISMRELGSRLILLSTTRTGDNTYQQSPQPDDLPDLSNYTVPQLKKPSMSHFGVTLRPRSDLHQDGPIMTLVVNGLL